MKTHLTTLIFLFWGATCFAQTSTELNLNDTSYYRILNGTIISNNYIIEDLGSIQCISDRQKKADLGIKTTLPLMFVNVKSFKIEYEIDSVLYNRPTFISSFKFPSTINLPISINGKLLTYQERKNVLAKLKFENIKEINYVDSSVAMTKYSLTPFGVIDVILK
jgi:hypothetical protein